MGRCRAQQQARVTSPAFLIEMSPEGTRPFRDALEASCQSEQCIQRPSYGKGLKCTQRKSERVLKARLTGGTNYAPKEERV